MCNTQAIGVRTKGRRGLILGLVLGAAAFSSTATAGRGGCNQSDLAPPFGVLDLADVNAFIDGFVNQTPQGDLDQNALWDLGDVTLFIYGFNSGCPAVECFEDIRTTVFGADLDPEWIRYNYDSINRTIHIFSTVSLADLFSTPFELLYPVFLEHLETLNECVPENDVDPAEIALVLEELSLVAGPMTAGDMLVFDPGNDPYINELLWQLRNLGIGVPEEPAGLEEVLARQEAQWSVISDAGAVTLADMFFKTEDEFSPDENVALDLGLSSGLLDAAVKRNDRCYEYLGDHHGYQCSGLSPGSWCATKTGNGSFADAIKNTDFCP